MRIRWADGMACLLHAQANRFDASVSAYKARLALAHSRTAACKTSSGPAKDWPGQRQTHNALNAGAAPTQHKPRRAVGQIPVEPLARADRERPMRRHDADYKKDWPSGRVRASRKAVALATDRVGNNQPLATN